VGQPTLQLRAANTAHKGPVASHVVLGLAIHAGLGPLAVDRLGRAVGRAVAVSPGEVVVSAWSADGSTRVRIDGGDPSWTAEACRILADHGARACPDGVELRLRRPPIAAAPDV
jgi:hypothetical protein